MASGERQLLALKFVREMGEKLSIRKMEVFDIRLVKEISNFLDVIGRRVPVPKWEFCARTTTGASGHSSSCAGAARRGHGRAARFKNSS